MHLRRRSLVGSAVLLGSAALLAVGCGDDDPGSTPDSGGESGSSSGQGGSSKTVGGSGGRRATGGDVGRAGAPELGGAAGADVGSGGQAGSTGEGGMGGAVAATAVTFEIPAGGGEVDVTTPSGKAITFDFPASAAGVTVTLTPDSSDSVGWTDGRFEDVIRMEPDGATFQDPIQIRTSSDDLLIFSYPTNPNKGPATGLALNAAGDALLLTHFSSLVVVPAGRSCDSQSGWQPTPNHAACVAYGTDSTRIDFTCKAYSYCLLIQASCCGPVGSTECELGMNALTLTYTPWDTNGGQYPYCDRQGGGGSGGTGGTGTGGTGSGGTSAGGTGSGGTPTGGTGTGGSGGVSAGGTGSGGTSTGGTASGGTGGSGTGGTGGGSASTETVAGETPEVNAIRLNTKYAYYNSGQLKRSPLTGGAATTISSAIDFSGTFDIDGTKAYFSYGGSMIARDRDGVGSDVDLLITGAVFSNSHIEESGGTLYIANGLNIYKAPIAGNVAATPLVSGEPSPQSLVVSGSDLYFVTYVGTGTHQKAIMKVPTAGGTAVPLIANLTESPASLAVSGGYVYYIMNSSISRISTAGGSAEPVAAAGGAYVAVDGSDVYFVNNSSLSHVGTTGQVVTPLVSSLSNPRLAIDATHVYFSTMSGPAPAPGVFRTAR